jgi:hypothetical protein
MAVSGINPYRKRNEWRRGETGTVIFGAPKRNFTFMRDRQQYVFSIDIGYR